MGSYNNNEIHSDKRNKFKLTNIEQSKNSIIHARHEKQFNVNTTISRAIVQCGNTTLIRNQEYETGLWKIPIENEKNGKGNEKSITITNRIKILMRDKTNLNTRE